MQDGNIVKVIVYKSEESKTATKSLNSYFELGTAWMDQPNILFAYPLNMCYSHSAERYQQLIGGHQQRTIIS